ncbi:MAG: hypothetical protein R3Y21_03895 [Mycoplasmatota bacterium]
MIFYISLFLAPILGYLLFIYKKNLKFKDLLLSYGVYVWISNFFALIIFQTFTENKYVLINELLFHLDFIIKYNFLVCVISLLTTLFIYFIKTQFTFDLEIVETKKLPKKQLTKKGKKNERKN